MGISAKKTDNDFFLKSFRMALIMGLIFIPISPGISDLGLQALLRQGDQRRPFT